VVVSGDWKQDLAPSVETVVALALREGITNVVRHARASRCEIELESLDGQLTLTMSDDGIGIARPEGSGLRGMRERVGAAGGKVEIEKHDPGTMLRVTMPVATP
jgi:two-component system sensor histidine kinase DesK